MAFVMIRILELKRDCSFQCASDVQIQSVRLARLTWRLFFSATRVHTYVDCTLCSENNDRDRQKKRFQLDLALMFQPFVE